MLIVEGSFEAWSLLQMRPHVKVNLYKTTDLGGPLMLNHQGVNYLSV